MNPEEFRKLLVKLVKACGQEVIDRAEDLVGNEDGIASFDIWLHFPTDGRIFDVVPSIEVTREHCSKKALDVLMEHYK